MNIKRAVIIPDSHVPFESKPGFKLLHQVCKYIDDQYGLNEIVILGDFADAFTLSSHGSGRTPKDPHYLKYEVERVNERLDEFNSYKDAKKVFILGNHEHRLERYLKTRCPELFGLVNIPELFNLDSRNWKYIPYDANQKYQILKSKLYARHQGFSTPKATATRMMCNIIYGHSHQIAEEQVTSLNGESFRAINAGCLVDINSSAFNYVQNHVNWQLAFSVLHVLDNGSFFNQMIHIINNTCIYDNRIFKSNKFKIFGG